MTINETQSLTGDIEMSPMYGTIPNDEVHTSAPTSRTRKYLVYAGVGCGVISAAVLAIFTFLGKLGNPDDNQLYCGMPNNPMSCYYNATCAQPCGHF